MKHHIKTIKSYPNDGNHLECEIYLPFQIRKGEDGYYYKDKKGNEYKYNLNENGKIDNRWIVHLKENSNESLIEIFEIKLSKDLNKIINYCYDIYEKSLNLELKRLKELKK